MILTFLSGIMTNPYILANLLEQEEEKLSATRYSREMAGDDVETEERQWRPFPLGGYMDVDVEELMGFNEDGDWELLEGTGEEEEEDDDDGHGMFDDNDFDEDGKSIVSGDDEVWSA